MTHAISAHSWLAKVGHAAMPNFKWATARKNKPQSWWAEVLLPQQPRLKNGIKEDDRKGESVKEIVTFHNLEESRNKSYSQQF